METIKCFQQYNYEVYYIDVKWNKCISYIDDNFIYYVIAAVV